MDMFPTVPGNEASSCREAAQVKTFLEEEGGLRYGGVTVMKPCGNVTVKPVRT